MQHIISVIATILITFTMQSSIAGIVMTTPQEATQDFLSGLKAGDEQTLEKYMDNTYVNFICNIEGDEAVVDRMNEALFKNFSYEIEQIEERNNVAVAKVIVKSSDFSDVMSAYSDVSYDYIMENLYEDSIADKDALNAKCLEIYVEQIEKAADSDAVVENTVFVPMIENEYYGWDIVMTDEFMMSVLGNLGMPKM